MHDTPLITTIVAGLVLAFVFGALANRLRLSPLVGYLIAGVLIGPATPGYVADTHLAPELAEIGVILLMFGVGLHFSHGRSAVGAAPSPFPAPSARSPPPRCSATASATGSAGRPAAASSSAWRCRSRAPWCCCAPCRSATWSRPSAAASPSAG